LENGKHVLSEKPIAATTQDSDLEHLLSSYQGGKSSSFGTWAIAENFRFLASFLFAAEQIKSMGKVLSFRTRMHKMVNEGEKFYGKLFHEGEISTKKQN